MELEKWLEAYLREKIRTGLSEFNSHPYIGYTLTALLMLNAFGGPIVSRNSTELLDNLNLLYAYGSLNFRRYPPFHRRRDHSGEGWLDEDYHTASLKDIIRKNGDEGKLLEMFHFPDGAVVRYDLKAPPGTYIMDDISSRKLNRDTGKWPLSKLVPYHRR